MNIKGSNFDIGKLYFSKHFHSFGSKIKHFSTFGSNQDDHEIFDFQKLTHLCKNFVLVVLRSLCVGEDNLLFETHLFFLSLRFRKLRSRCYAVIVFVTFNPTTVLRLCCGCVVLSFVTKS